VSVALVADDEPTIRRLVAAILTQSGCEPMTAPDAENGVASDYRSGARRDHHRHRAAGIDGVAFAHWVRDDDRSADMTVALMGAWEDALAFPQPSHGFVSPISNLAPDSALSQHARTT
jgi:DNA-binding response OmpR family regulator